MDLKEQNGMAHNTSNMRRTETRPAEVVGGGVDSWMAGYPANEKLWRLCGAWPSATGAPQRYAEVV